MEEFKIKKQSNKDDHVKRRWFIIFVFVLGLGLFYTNGRDIHITENIGEREVEVF